jgi:hypothetical protein
VWRILDREGLYRMIGRNLVNAWMSHEAIISGLLVEINLGYTWKKVHRRNSCTNACRPNTIRMEQYA